MGRSSGTGQPIHFTCAAARWPGCNRHGHAVTLTGRTKRNPGNARGRMDQISREYQCKCGHIGWSAHKDLANKGKPS